MRQRPDPSPARSAEASSEHLKEEISERRQAEEDLRKSEWRLRYATESAGLTYVEVDLVRGQARTPDNFAAVMGYVPPPEQERDVSAGTRLLLAHVVPQDRARVAAAHEELLAGTPAGKLDYRVLGDDQVERWIETRWSVELARDGTPLKSFATHLDITERKRAGEGIRQSEERYRHLFDSIDEGFCVIEVILMDLGMPKLNGFEAARQIRQQPWSKGMVLVALTGWGQEEDRNRTAEAGFDGHLVKPVEFDTLTKLLAGFPVVAE